ncbi:MAG: hypothetical protein LBF86_04000 [Helicobacteraceae bacterium]|nr:hypothetical protein [Helicobacteraceae bacterium]
MANKTPANASDSVNETTAPPKSAVVGSPPPPPEGENFGFCLPKAVLYRLVK